jgi:type I restriction enzyme S subunit
VKLKPYPEYKDSGVEWIMSVPAHWGIGQSRRIFSQRKDRAYPDDEQLTASQKYGVIPQKEYMALEDQSVMQVSTGAEILKHVEPNDFVISMRSFQGGIEWCGHRGCVSSAYVPLIPSKNVVPGYFRYLFKSIRYIQALQSTSNLVRDGQALRFENFSLVPLPILSYKEQTSIATFLDCETAKLDTLIAKQEKLIERINERIIATVMAAMTSVETQYVRFVYACEVISRPVNQASDDSFVRLGILNRGRGLFKREEADSEDMGDSDFFWVKKGDLILSGQFAWEGSVAMAEDEHDGCVVSHRFPIINGKPGVASTEYLLALLMSPHGDFLLNENSRGSAGRNRPLNLNLLLKEKIPIASMAVQNEVAKLLTLRRKLIEKVQRSIELAKEHRTALISAAVTGKIDVREHEQ